MMLSQVESFERNNSSILLQLRHDFCPLGLAIMTSALAIMDPGCLTHESICYHGYLACQNELQVKTSCNDQEPHSADNYPIAKL
jgi:hypothetical protein